MDGNAWPFFIIYRARREEHLESGIGFRGLAGKFVVSPIVFNVMFQFYRKEVAEWAQKSQWNAKRVIASHFPVPESATGEDFWRLSNSQSRQRLFLPVCGRENDLASLNLVVRILQAINAVPKYE